MHRASGGKPASSRPVTVHVVQILLNDKAKKSRRSVVRISPLVTDQGETHGFSTYGSKLGDLIALWATIPALLSLRLIQHQLSLANGADYVIAQLNQPPAFGANEMTLGNFLV